MIQKKICMMGAFAVGKTSLVSRFVQGIFSEKYLTTVGVKIDRSVILTEGRTVNLILWDLHGEDDFQKVRMSYLRGSAGYVLVVDLTRRETLDKAVQLHEEAQGVIGAVPFVLAANKADLTLEREIQEPELDALKEQGWNVITTSAKSSLGVREAFTRLAEMILEMK